MIYDLHNVQLIWTTSCSIPSCEVPSSVLGLLLPPQIPVLGQFHLKKLIRIM
jgi:hypothetical protein